jgi:tetratricopeptide (TPR) repeat protein
MEDIIGRALEKDRELRYQSARDMRAELQRLKRDTDSGRVGLASLGTVGVAQEVASSAVAAPTAASASGPAVAAYSTPSARKVAEVPVVGRKFRKILVPAVAMLLAALIVGALYLRSHRVKPLTDKDTIVLADFVNTTGDAVFDESLKRALSVSLEQSPFLSLVSDQQVQQILRLMGKPSNAALSQDVAREVCQRNQSKAMLTGAISAVGSQYEVTLEAVNCVNGDALARVGAVASNKDKVLDSLGQAASEMRGKLGESLASVQQYDTPLSQVTTTSLDALKTYSLGIKALDEKGPAVAIPYFKRAIELDPNFASAYALAATEYGNLGEFVLASEYAKRAYELRERVTEREKLALEVQQTAYITGDVVKDEQIVELWKHTYPRDIEAFKDATADKMSRGDFQASLEDSQKAVQLNRFDEIAVGNLAQAYTALNRVDNAKAILDQGLANGIDPASVANSYYPLAFLRNDLDTMQKQLALAAGKAGYENSLFAMQAETEGYHGRLKQARDYTRRAAESAEHNGNKEVASVYILDNALREAEFGNFAESHRAAVSAIQLAPNGRYVRAVAAFVLARAGDTAQAQKLADTLEKEFPQDTYVNAYWLAMARASMELKKDNPTKAVELLRAAQTYELGTGIPGIGNGLVVYLRGYALLDTGRNKEAGGEFQRILDHPGIVLNSPVGALARLGLARALMASGDMARARSAYQDFFALWKDADPDIPILRQAKAEYSKLQ